MATATAAKQDYHVSLSYTDRQYDVFDRVFETPTDWKCFVGFGGALGGGKSYFLALAIFQLGVLTFPGSRILLGRNELGPLEKTTLRYFLETVLLPKGLMEHDKNARIVRIRLDSWPDGLWTELHYHPLSDAEKVQGEEYNIILVDEANGITLETMGYLSGRLRFQLKHPELAKKKPIFIMICASNPHPGWYTDWFWRGEVLKNVDGTVVPGKVRRMTDDDRSWRFFDQMTDVHFVRSMMKDNKYLPPGYAQQAMIGMDPGLAKRFIEGRFDVFEGAVFTEFRPTSVLNTPHGHIWDVPEMPNYTAVVGGIDTGGETSTAHYTTGLVGVRTEAGRTIIVDEFKERGAGVDMKLAEWITRMEMKWARPIHKQISWTASRDQKWGLKWLARGAQIHIKPNRATFDAREQNVAEIQRMFLHNLLFLRPECVGLREELRNYVYDQKAIERTGDVKFRRKNDDLVDALQYLIEGAGKPVGDPAALFANAYAAMR